MTGLPPGKDREKSEPYLGNQPWDQQEHESGKAFQAFRIYRDLDPARTQGSPGSRSTAEVRRILGKDKRHIERWCRANEWVRRAEAWDAHLDRNRQRGMEEAAAKAGEQVAQQAHAMLAALAMPIRELIQRWQDDPKCLGELSTGDLLAIVTRVPRASLTAALLQRLGMGLSKWPDPADLDPAKTGAEVFRIILEDEAKTPKRPPDGTR